MIKVSFESGYNKVLYFSSLIDIPIWEEEPVLDIRLEEPYKIVCEGLNAIFDSFKKKYV